MKKNFSEEKVQKNIESLISIHAINDENMPDVELIKAEIPPEGMLSAPLRLYISITNACNLRCKHCLNTSFETLSGELSFEEIHEIFKEMQSLGIPEISIGGGEPFLRQDFPDIIALAEKMDLNISIATNGLLITEKIAKQLASFDNIKYIALSLEGAKPETHDYIRGKGTFRRVIRALSILKKHSGQHVNLHFTIQKHNFNETEQIFSLSHELPADSLGMKILIPCGNAAINRELILSHEEFIHALKKMHELAITSTKPSFVPLYYPPGSTRILYPHFGCGAANVTCGITALGEMLPCNFLPAEFGGESIRRKSIKEIWRTNPSFKKLRSLKGNPKCLACKYYSFCRGHCRASALYFHGDIEAPDLYCCREEELHFS
ncbi:MAG: radical SAM protein [Chloroflexi bacterium]|nr:radical SAM protein [Chloroflexota bacterium]